MALRELYSSNPLHVATSAKFKRGDVSQMASSTTWGVCTGEVVLWLRSMLTDGVHASRPPEGGDATRVNPSRAALLHGKCQNRIISEMNRSVYSDMHAYRLHLTTVKEEHLMEMLRDVGLRPEPSFTTQAISSSARIHGQPGGYVIGINFHALGFVTESAGNGAPYNYYFYDPNTGVLTTSEVGDLIELDHHIYHVYSSVPQFRKLWHVNRALL